VDRALLRRFYEGLYVAEFPDADERESLANIERYLELRGQGWYGPNNYHVALLLEDGEPIGGVIADYLATPDTGVLEFLVVDRARRRRGIGSRLLEWIEANLADDAVRAGGRLRGFVAELNDPFTCPVPDSLDPFERLEIWGAWGYARLDFPYVQPALSADQNPVRHLLLALKWRGPRPAAVDPGFVRGVVHEYIRWAMRIPEPAACAEYAAMAGHLAGRADVPLVPLAAYVGEDAARPLQVREVESDTDPDLEATLAAYTQAFAPGPTTVTPEEFRRALAERRTRREPGATYHLWALRSAAGGPVGGMTSFFGLPGAGFGGYIALGPGLRGTGRLPLLLARIERQLVQDRLGARGWYIECERTASAIGRFRRAGFHEIAVDYRQPDLSPSVAGPVGVPLALLYKDFGAHYATPAVPVDDFRAALAHIYRVVYRVAAPAEHPLYRLVAVQAGRAGPHLVFR
jgi:GNAT superfamily N-acetyltransferase